MSNSTDFTVVDFTKRSLDIIKAIHMAIANKQEDNKGVAKVSKEQVLAYQYKQVKTITQLHKIILGPMQKWK